MLQNSKQFLYKHDGIPNKLFFQCLKGKKKHSTTPKERGKRKGNEKKTERIPMRTDEMF